MTSRVVALVAARNEADLIASTVEGLLTFADEVVVVDDASTDETTSLALGAGATVVRVPARAGKGRVLEGAMARMQEADVWVLADGDLGSSAGALARLVEAVLSDGADLAIADPPEQPGGGFGIVKTAAGLAVAGLTGFRPRAPLSGQRAISGGALAACRPLARGFGVEVAMTVDALRAGLRVVELPVQARHRPTGRSLSGFVHRARQGLDILRAVAPRALGLR
jgi:glycosyltransferase involved in cell wall biosynthesis